MKTRLILKPGQPGTKSLAKKYGDTDSSKFVNGVLDKIKKTELDNKMTNDKAQNPK